MYSSVQGRNGHSDVRGKRSSRPPSLAKELDRITVTGSLVSFAVDNSVDLDTSPGHQHVRVQGNAGGLESRIERRRR